MPSYGLVAIETFTDYDEAQLRAAALRAAGLRAVLPHDARQRHTRGGPLFVTRDGVPDLIELLVPEEQEERAREVLAAHDERLLPPAFRDGEVGAWLDESRSRRRQGDERHRRRKRTGCLAVLYLALALVVLAFVIGFLLTRP